MSKKVIRRLGERLNHIFQWIESAEPYGNIWDLCCDHGRLGLHLHERYSNTCVTLVDKVARIVDKLVADYGDLNDGRLHFKVADVCQLEITAQKRTLVIIAGVGGQNLIAMLEAILVRLPVGDRLEFMLSPNSHMFELRKFLRARSFALIDEAFVVEKSFCHEHLWLRFTQNATDDLGQYDGGQVSEVGDNLWQNMTDTKRTYIRKLLGHYQRQRDNEPSALSYSALKAYGRLL